MADPTKLKKMPPEKIKQGVEPIYPGEHEVELNAKTNLDIVFVPGLGANPRESWQSTNTGWNWAFSKDGLIRDYPTARIFLYSQESAIHGRFKVEQFLDNLAFGLLNSLQARREEKAKRPLVFIGHSMGGLIIAKAITLMDSRRDLYKEMLEATTGCIFFGTPFFGTQAAAVAAMFAYVGEKFGMAIDSKLLELMKPDDEMLRELTGEFHRLISKTSPKIEVHCFWEEHDTRVADMGADLMKKRMGDGFAKTFYNLCTMAEDSFKIVSRKSATLTGVDNSGLACNHRDLVKFDDFKDGRYQVMRGPLTRILYDASRVAKKRLNSARDIDVDGMKNITKALGGGMHFRAKRKALEQRFVSSSWLPNESNFTEWLACDHSQHVTDASDRHRGDSLWICGAEGRGKTGASIAALEQIEATTQRDGRAASGEAPLLLAYYFCDPTDSTAEELLKSLIWQLTQEEPALAPYAKQFTERQGRKPLSLTIETLWQSLQDMFSDLVASSRIYILINNLHNLSEESGSTQKLLELVKDDLKDTKAGAVNRTSVRWLITSRKASPNIERFLGSEVNRVIDLDNERYMNRVQLELRKHAQKRVAELSIKKEYKKDLAYFVSSLIANRARKSGWIDITIDQLEELPKVESALSVRQKLKSLPQNLDDLLDGAWKQIFESNPSQVDVIKEILRALVLAYEDPSLQELAILAGFPTDKENLDKLRATIELCSSFLIIRFIDGKGDFVCFKNDIAKPHLLDHAAKLLGLSEEETQWQQGELALRSLAHLVDRFTLPGDKEKLDAERLAEENERKDQENKTGADGLHVEDDGDENASEETDDEDYESDDEDDSEYQEELEAAAEPYMVKHWLHHASKATPDMAEDLSRETEFWGRISLVRRRWLAQYKNLSDNFRFSKEMTLKKWTALHVAASFGYRMLVSALLDNGHEDELNEYDDYANAPIHLAANYGRPNITDELLRRGAAADAVENPGDDTPLALAAYEGNIKVMELLLAKSADVNAESTFEDSEQSVLNYAIYSGNLKAVGLLVDNGAIIHSDKYSPLQSASELSDRKIFDYLLKAGQAHLQPCDYGMALNGAAEYGNEEIFAELLEYKHEQKYVQEALESATDEEQWGIVRLILDKHKGLECDDLFMDVATAAENLEELLEVVWHYADGSISQEALDDALYEATDNEKENIVRKLLTFGADANATGLDYGNALTAAAFDGRHTIVAMLLNAGAHVNSKNGWALQTAAGEGHVSIVELLLDAGAELNTCTDNERFPQGTALQAAVESGKSDIVTLLLSKGADPNLGSGLYVCPLIAAACKAEGEMLKQLVAAGANVNFDGRTPLASTPLLNTAMNLPVEYVQMLLDAGADINHADVVGNTALIVAAAQGDTQSVKCLLDRGADIRATSSIHGNTLEAGFKRGNQDCIQVLIEHVSRILLEDAKDKTGGADGGDRHHEVRREGNPNKESEGTKTSEDKDIMANKWAGAKKYTYDGDDWGDEGNRNVKRTAPAEVHMPNAPFSIPRRPIMDPENRGISLSSTCTPSPQHLPPQSQQYVKQYDQQYGQQQQYRALPPQQNDCGLPLLGKYPYQVHPAQAQQQWEPQQRYGAPPPSLTPGYRAAS